MLNNWAQSVAVLCKPSIKLIPILGNTASSLMETLSVSGQPSQLKIVGPDHLQSLASALPPRTLLGRKADTQNGELVLSRRYSSEEFW